MQLPLTERVSLADPIFCFTPENRTAIGGSRKTDLIPQQALRPGEQYRFHFDMTKCIGCHCCEVACSEQNNNPSNLHWRRVGEIEGASYPFTQRFYLSLACNHCVDPSCLKGCPVDAYTKDALTGIVLHSAEACIGCQYCTWNCQYGVPQYNPERGVVGKCDLCYNRLSDGREPACVSACPEGAIQVEIVDIAEWKHQYQLHGNAPGMPTADSTVSTTRITLPDNLPAELERADYHRVRPEHSHLPLVLMTVLTQLAVGAFVCIWLLGSFRKSQSLGLAAAAAFGVANVALAASTLHLGRPIHAYRALRMWKRSWLSREVLLFTLFAGTASSYAGMLWLGDGSHLFLGASTAMLGLAGVFASACIYLVPARPAWNSAYTVADFFFTTVCLGPAFVFALMPSIRELAYVAMAGAGLQVLNHALKFLWLVRSDEFELRASSRLLSSDLRHHFLFRFILLITGAILIPGAQPTVGFLNLLAAELLGRYLFYVSTVPKSMAASFGRRAA